MRNQRRARGEDGDEFARASSLSSFATSAMTLPMCAGARQDSTTWRNLYSMSSGLSGFSGLPRRCRTSFRSAAVTRRDVHARGMAECGAHALDFRIDAACDALDEIEYLRIAQAVLAGIDRRKPRRRTRSRRGRRKVHLRGGHALRFVVPRAMHMSHVAHPGSTVAISSGFSLFSRMMSASASSVVCMLVTLACGL